MEKVFSYKYRKKSYRDYKFINKSLIIIREP